MDSILIYQAANDLVQNTGTRNIKRIARSCSLDIIWGTICGTTTPSTMHLSSNSTCRNIIDLMLPDESVFL